MPEEHYKEIKKIKAELVKMVKDIDQKVWLHIKTPVDIWNYCLDSKYDIVSALSMSYPLYDEKEYLGTLRLAEIHKSLVLKKFEKYVTSYVLGGSFVTGKAKKTSDVDVYVIIDDTDVKRLPRLQLKEKLRRIIYQYEAEARNIAGVGTHLHIQTYILTDFWENVKDANPVIFTFIRDGVPIYDKGTFMPWKLLLKMGKLKPSPEAIDKFMAMGDKVTKKVEMRLTDLVIKDIYWGVLTPSQALLMLYGLPPPTSKETPKIFRKVFVEEESILEKEYADILERIVKIYKDFEHKKIEDGDIKGKDVDKFLEDTEKFLKRLKELREQIEKKAGKRTIKEMYENISKILKSIFDVKTQKSLINKFEKELVKKGKLPKQDLKILKRLVKAKRKKKMKRNKVEKVRKDSNILLNHLIEYKQRKEILSLQRGNLRLKTEDNIYDLILTSKKSFLIDDKNIHEIDMKNKKLKDTTKKELSKELKEQEEVKANPEIFEILEKEIGEFEIIF